MKSVSYAVVKCARYLLEPALLAKPKPSRYKDLLKRATRTAGGGYRYSLWLTEKRQARGGGLIVPLSVTVFLKQIQTAAEAEFVCGELKLISHLFARLLGF
jgi:hypothetical protein